MRNPRKKKQTGETMRMLFLVTQVGLCMISAIAVGGLLGYGADRLFGTSPILFFVGFVLGIAAGFRSAWMLLRKYVKDPAEEPEKTEAEKLREEQLRQTEEEFRRWKEQKGNDDGR